MWGQTCEKRFAESSHIHRSRLSFRSSSVSTRFFTTAGYLPLYRTLHDYPAALRSVRSVLVVRQTKLPNIAYLGDAAQRIRQLLHGWRQLAALAASWGIEVDLLRCTAIFPKHASKRRGKTTGRRDRYASGNVSAPKKGFKPQHDRIKSLRTAVQLHRQR